MFWEHWQFWVQLLISISILTSAFLCGSMKITGWIILMIAQSIFITYVIITQQWGLLPQNVGMGLIAVRNFRKWKREGIGYQRKASPEGAALA